MRRNLQDSVPSRPIPDGRFRGNHGAGPCRAAAQKLKGNPFPSKGWRGRKARSLTKVGWRTQSKFHKQKEKSSFLSREKIGWSVLDLAGTAPGGRCRVGLAGNNPAPGGIEVKNLGGPSAPALARAFAYDTTRRIGPRERTTTAGILSSSADTLF